MQGIDDHDGSVAQVGAIIEGADRLSPKLMLPDCGHNPHSGQPKMAINAIGTFILHQVFGDSGGQSR